MSKRKKIKSVDKLKKQMKINQAAVNNARISRSAKATIKDFYPPPSAGKTAYEKTISENDQEKNQLAMDSFLDQAGLDFNKLSIFGSSQFIGYAALSTLMQSGLLSLGVEVIADEMTRKFIDISYSGEDQTEESAETIQELKAMFKDLKVPELFNDAATNSGFFGGCLVYIGFDVPGLEKNQYELKTPLKQWQVEEGIKYLNVIEPINCYPGRYKTINPLEKTFYEPETWYILGKEVHHTRLLFFAENKTPVLLKPSYNFFGIPTVQKVLEYAENFFGSRDAAVKMLKKFSLTYLKTDLSSILGGGTDTKTVDNRADLFATYRDNDSMALVDKDMEDIAQINTPLSGLDTIVRQTLEFVAMIFKIPTVKFLGISPGGMNATGESDFQNFYDHIKSLQEKRFKRNIQRLIDLFQMSKGKTPDPCIEFNFIPLKEMTAKEQAEINKMKQETDSGYTQDGTVGQEEVRKRLADDPESGYDGIDIDNVPEAPNEYNPNEEE